jgi:ABC-type multidrug transport system ATPase subunit
LLNNISIHIAPRQFVALVGGSGAGKSTLMDALNGMRPATSGRVFYNGRDFFENRAAFSGQIGYVPQEDIVHRDLTVGRALYYAAKLRLPADFSSEQIEKRISEVLEDVEMTNRRSLLVRKLSGGQRKRVSIALELLANPSIFFLDEPTSGLDPGLDRKMMHLLRKLADKGHTIVLVTHATNNITVCDQICFLAQGGRVAFFGPPDEAMKYFGTDDFAEIYTRLEATDERPNTPEIAEDQFKQSATYQTYVTRPLAQLTSAQADVDQVTAVAKTKSFETARRGNAFTQFGLLTRRSIELLKNNRSYFLFLLLQAPLLAVLVMVLIRFEVGPGIYDSAQVVQCAPRIVQRVVTVPPSQANPTGEVQIGIDTSRSADPNAAVDCQEIRKLLSGDPTSKADADMIRLAKEYTHLKGGGDPQKALQDFIVAGASLNTLSSTFVIAFVAGLFGCINGTREIVKEASIYRRERAVNLGIVPYVFSKIAVLGAFAVFQSIALLLIVQLFEPFGHSVFLPSLLEVFITVLLTGICGLLAGLAISSVAGNEDTANTLLPFILIPQIVFAGALFALRDWPLQVIGLAVPLRWTMIAMGTTLGLHSDKLNGDAILGADTAYHGTLLSTFSQQEAMRRLLLAWGALALIMIILIVVICLMLKRMDVGRRPQRRWRWLRKRVSRA